MINDMLFNDDGTFQEANGDFVFGDASAFLMEDILLATPGHYKEFPVLGANVTQYINARANIQVISRDIKVALQQDVFVKPIIDLSEFPSKMAIDNLVFEINPNGV